MKRDDINTQLSAEEIATLLPIVQDSSAGRIQRVQLKNRVVWIKRHHIGNTTFTKRAHGLFSKITRYDFLKSSPLVKAAEKTEREKRKNKAFLDAGLAAPKILWSHGTVLVLSNVEPKLIRHVHKFIKEEKQEQANDLIVKFGLAIADIHKAGLCHGRPHTRDSFLEDGKIGFFDFEEEPEASMPLPMAQARDFWLAMLQVCFYLHDETGYQKVFDHWIESVSPDTREALLMLNNYFVPTLKIADRIPENMRGNDLKRGMAATRFIQKAFAELSIAKT